MESTHPRSAVGRFVAKSLDSAVATVDLAATSVRDAAGAVRDVADTPARIARNRQLNKLRAEADVLILDREMKFDQAMTDLLALEKVTGLRSIVGTHRRALRTAIERKNHALRKLERARAQRAALTVMPPRVKPADEPGMALA